MEKNKVIISSLAEIDLEQNAIYIAYDKRNIANKFLSNFWDTCELLQEMPKIGKSVARNFPEINELLEDVRSWHIKDFSNFLIFYKKIRNEIIILRVLNSSRNFPSIFKK